ncbi:gamma-glutamylcyclotransferase family protein [Kocuria sp.]|uniref:gamma-glutamylcyclotransferase family protein n=1 Tax=Kocuria sp. TaxID=1871328 RepID=UPI0026DFD6BF|nr:gamma-glutamylcyclotransferase family protein [Kocuria sp.]MDO5619812.1 gamma-glutamylcyclotransferase family protein [Kocuria sp.]
MDINSLFIYGTLAPGRPNEHVLKPLGGVWQRGAVCGRLVQKGWGAASGHPAIVLDSSARPPVEGWLLTAESLPDWWVRLDEFEGAEYQRVLTEVELDDGSTAQAWIYALADPVV